MLNSIEDRSEYFLILSKFYINIDIKLIIKMQKLIIYQLLSKLLNN